MIRNAVSSFYHRIAYCQKVDIFTRVVLIYSVILTFIIHLLPRCRNLCVCPKKESTLNFSQIGQYLPTKHGPWNFPWDLHGRNHTKTKNLHHFFNFYSSHSISVDKNLYGMLEIFHSQKLKILENQKMPAT